MKVRVISAIVLLLVFIPFLIIGELPFAIFLSVLAVMGLYELLKARETKKSFPFTLKILAYILVFLFSMYDYSSIEFQYQFDYRVFIILIFLFMSPLIIINDFRKYSINDALFLIGSILFIGLSFNLINIIRNYDLMYIVFLLLITTMSDTFALITGKLVGKHKLTSISPNKTVEGLIGGVIMGVFTSVAFYHSVINPSTSLPLLVFVSCALCLVGQFGDLVFSFIKRDYDVKDYSNLIPGHGGILDRFDSLIFVAFAFIILKGLL